MFKRILSFMLAVIAIAAMPLSAGAQIPQYAKGYVLIEASTGTVLEGKDENKVLPMASTTKIMTALVTLENSDLNSVVKIPSVATNIEGSSMYLIEGEQLTVEQLLYGLMLTSGNDASMALAYHVGGGSIDNFVRLMNQKAKELGLENTSFENPSGLDGENHHTTALELAKITCAALENEKFAEIVKTKSKRVPYNNNPDGRSLTNHNKLLNMYEYAIGVKTGFTKKSGRCLVSAAQKDSVTLICVTLGASDDWNVHKQAYEDGFKRVQYKSLAPSGQFKAVLKAAGGSTVTAANTSDVGGIYIDKNYDFESVTSKVYAEHIVYAPKQKGDIVGKVCYYCNGELIGQSDLALEEDLIVEVKRNLFITRIINFFKGLFGI